MVAPSITLWASLALTASAAKYSNTTTVDTTVYTTVCPATSVYTSGTQTFTSTYTTISTITSCKGGCPTPTGSIEYCQKVRAECQSQPDPNEAECAAKYVACAGTTSGLNAAPAPTTSSIANCQKVRSDCQFQPDANQAVCAAKYAACAGTTSSLNQAPAPSAPTSASPDCDKVRSNCQSQPDANQAECAAKYVACAGTTSGLNKPAAETTIYTTVCPVTSTNGSHTSIYQTTSTITSCKGGCSPTAAPSAPIDCDKVRSDCQSQPDANQAVCAAKYFACAGTTSGLNKPASTTAAPPASTSAISACQDQYNKCRIGPDANMSFCVAQFALCKGSSSANTTMTTSVATTQSVAVVSTTGAGASTSGTSPVELSTGGAALFKPAYAGLFVAAALVVLL